MERITSRRNPLITRLRRLGTDKKARRAEGLFLCEGDKLVGEALRWGAQVELLAAAEGTPAPAGLPAHTRVVELPAELLAYVSTVDTPQNMLALCCTPALTPPEALSPGRYLVLDGVQDPGNVGTIWRTADAAGLGGLLLGANCADPYNPKVQRAAMGSGFRLPAIPADPLCEALAFLRARGWTVVASALDGADFYQRPEVGERFVLVIGSEAHGISDAVRAQADALVKLPMRGRAESLNAAVAAGIMMYEMTRS